MQIGYLFVIFDGIKIFCTKNVVLNMVSVGHTSILEVLNCILISNLIICFGKLFKMCKFGNMTIVCDC